MTLLDRIEILQNAGNDLDTISTKLGLSVDEINDTLKSGEEEQTLATITNDYELVIPYLESLKHADKDSIRENILRTGQYISEQVLYSLNSAEKLNNLGKAAVIMEKLSALAENMPSSENTDTNEFSRYLRD